jgi:hypothetical protein
VSVLFFRSSAVPGYRPFLEIIFTSVLRASVFAWKIALMRFRVNNISSFAIYVNRNDSRRDQKNKGPSDERLKKLDAVSPTCRLDQWWPNVKGSLGLPEALDNQFIWCVQPTTV